MRTMPFSFFLWKIFKKNLFYFFKERNISILSIIRNLQMAETNMSRLATGLDDVDKQVAVLREQLAVSTREGSEIEIGLNKARQTLSVSQNLVLELADEYDRWRLQVLTFCPLCSLFYFF